MSKDKKISIKGLQPKKELFHDEEITVYFKDIHVDEITFWHENARNLLDFDLLERKYQKKLAEISDKEIILFLASQTHLKLSGLKKSVLQNCVRVPLVILDDGTLLDGNRRFFACKLIQYEHKNKGLKIPGCINKIPAYIIQTSDISDIGKEKILAEANFVDDHKVPWTDDVKAKVISKFYQCCIDSGRSEDEAYKDTQEVYSLNKSKIQDYIRAYEIVNVFCDSANDDKERIKFRQIVQKKFVYFWEFYNKSERGRGALDSEQLREAKEAFFMMMSNERFQNIKQVEPMIRAKREDYLWKMITESKGVKIGQVEAIIRENKAVKSIDDKFRNFLRWIESQPPEAITKQSLANATIKIIEQLINKLNNIIGLK